MERAKLIKDTVSVTNAQYLDPRTIPLIFRFTPQQFESVRQRMGNCSVQQISIDGKMVYLFDGFFTEKEGEELRQFSKTATFSREIFASSQSIQMGQLPIRSMNSKEKWTFFANPPSPVQEFYKLLSHLSSQMKVDIATFPWDLISGSICSPAVATNLVREYSKENMELDKHKDVDLQMKGISFAIPNLYAKEKSYFPNHFVNGAAGKPWLVSAMLYSTASNFRPAHGMGTVFYKDNGEKYFRADCLHMRLVLFEGDIIHGVECSNLPEGVSTERVSYVFKLTMNPLQESQSAKNAFSEWIRNRV